jgi:hypothetical protein
MCSKPGLDFDINEGSLLPFTGESFFGCNNK